MAQNMISFMQNIFIFKYSIMHTFPSFAPSRFRSQLQSMWQLLGRLCSYAFCICVLSTALHVMYCEFSVLLLPCPLSCTTDSNGIIQTTSRSCTNPRDFERPWGLEHFHSWNNLWTCQTLLQTRDTCSRMGKLAF